MDAGSEYERNLAEEVAKLQRLYGGGDLTTFPEFKFTGDKEPQRSQTAEFLQIQSETNKTPESVWISWDSRNSLIDGRKSCKIMNKTVSGR